jgi:uncharacterized coiled-coil DUF342 family protein
MKAGAFRKVVLVAILLCGGTAVVEAGPLFLPQTETGPPPLSAAESEELKKEADQLQRKAALLKAAADKKYAAARELRKKAGVLRTESSNQGDALRSKAQQSAEMSSLIGDMFGIMSSMGGMSGMGTMSSNAMVAQSLTGQMIQGQQSADAKGVMGAQMAAGQLAADAEKKAGPLELRADELETEGNRLMEANNRLVGIANAKSLLAASDELLKKIDSESRILERLKEGSRLYAASPSAPAAR